MRYGAVGLLDSQTCSNVFFWGANTTANDNAYSCWRVKRHMFVGSTAYNPLWLVLCTLLFAKSAVLWVEQ